jgi:RNA polymerase sigma-70 factor (ECF subfamily)
LYQEWVANPLDAVVLAARARWPGLAIDSDAFARHVTQLGDGVVTDELCLAFACACSDRTAIAAFEREYFTDVAAFVARTDPDPMFADEVRQLLRHRLFVADAGAAPKIATYNGRGPLGAWLRTVAVRIALELVRARKPNLPLDDDTGGLAAPQADPELDYLKTRYAAEVGAAFAEVLAGLPTRERNILRLHYLEGVTIEAIAAMYTVNRKTISRWLADWRANIYRGTQLLLRQRLKVDAAELESLLRFVQTRLDLSIRRHLA